MDTRTRVSTLLRAIVGTGHLVDCQLDDVLGRQGLSISKLGVLHHLVKAGGPLPLGKLAERLACGKSNVTQLVDRLEQEGLVRRIADPDDRRCMRAVITEEGRRRYELGVKAELETEKQLAGDLSAAEQQTLLWLLAKFDDRRKV